MKKNEVIKFLALRKLIKIKAKAHLNDYDVRDYRRFMIFDLI